LTWGLRPRLYAYACFAGYVGLLCKAAVRNLASKSTSAHLDRVSTGGETTCKIAVKP
jgi:hypothetical protein